jgi:hypothetical protein
MAVQYDKTGGDLLHSPLLPNFGGSRRRHRFIALFALAFFLVSALWTYHNLAIVEDDWAARLRVNFPGTAAPPSSSSPPAGSARTGLGAVARLIPQKIWQIMLPREDVEMWNVDPEQLRETTSWLAKNIDYS